MSPDSRVLADYEDYIRRELPRLVRSDIEEVERREMQSLETSLINTLPGIIRDCQDRVFRAYREAQRVEHELEIPLRENGVDSLSPGHTDITKSEIPTQSLDSYPQRSDFLDTVFQLPLAVVPGTVLPIVERNETISRIEPSSSSDTMLSDFGYGSGQLKDCGRQDLLICVCAVRHETEAVDANNLLGSDDMGVEDMELNDFNSDGDWSQMVSNGADFDLWTGS